MFKDKISVLDINIKIDKNNYLSLTDIAKKKNSDDPRDVIRTWMRSKSTIQFLGFWEKFNNVDFKEGEFNRFKIENSENYSSISPTSWVKSTNAKGIFSISGRYNSGTYAHKDIAIEFASWISVEFRFYLIKEFQRLKEKEKSQEWNLSRALTKINYSLQTEAIKEHLIPKELSIEQKKAIYSSEADLLNIALFGLTSQQFKKLYPKKKGNLREYANVTQLVCLSNLESLNSVLINEGISQEERLEKLNQIAISQMKILVNNIQIKTLEEKK